MMRTDPRADANLRRVIRSCRLGAVVSLACALAVPALADHHLASEGSSAETDASAPQTTPPPGTLSSEGIVPPTLGMDGAGGEAGDAGPHREEVGHVPGPDEGVYGDPPNSGSGNPEDRDWAYDLDYFFALTRGLETDTDLSPTGVRWVRPLTFTFDLVTLPTAALAGLTGRAPATETADHDDASSAPAEDADATMSPESETGAEPSMDPPDAGTAPAEGAASGEDSA